MPDDHLPSLFEPAAVPQGSVSSGGPAGSVPGTGKAPDALLTIGEVSAALAIRQHVLRYWEDQFPMLRPLKRSGGRRYYRPDDVALVQRIDQLVHRDGFTLRGARLVLEGSGPDAPVEPMAQVAQPAAGRADGALADRLKAIRLRLAAAAG